MSKKEITSSYLKLINDVATKDYYKTDLTNRVNCYSCDKCKTITKTKDIDAGVTPMFIDCGNCGKSSVSSFYKDIAPHQMPTVEWYRPSLKKTLKIKSPGLLDHVLRGGLIQREITKSASKNG